MNIMHKLQGQKAVLALEWEKEQFFGEAAASVHPVSDLQIMTC